MKLARYVGQGRIAIVDEPEPEPLPGGLILENLASGLCSGELMSWYMERKVPHVIGHEVVGRVVWSDDDRFPIGSLVAPHHHAPCLNCEWCVTGRFVHCERWRKTKLVPGGMAERFFVSSDLLTDAHRVDDLRPQDGALVEPLACVMKGITRALSLPGSSHPSATAAGSHLGEVAVIGLGVMGLLHMLSLGSVATGYDVSPIRREWAEKQAMSVGDLEAPKPADTVFVCPGTPAAFELGMSMVRPGGTLVMFSPFDPGESPKVDWDAVYFNEIRIVPSYSCGPGDLLSALKLLRAGAVKAENVVSDFIALDELPGAYLAMKEGRIVKPMVLFESRP